MPRPSKWLAFFLLAGLVFSCTVGERPVYTSLPLKTVPKHAKGEQKSVLKDRGIPDCVYEGPWGTTRWVYCAPAPGPLLIEFDRNGEILSVTRSPDEICLAQTEPGNLRDEAPVSELGGLEIESPPTARDSGGL